MAKGVTVTLYDAAGAAYASGTDIAVMWFDSALPPDLGQIKGKSAVATTTAGGVLSLDLDNVTGLAVGEFGFLVCYKLDGTDHRDSPVFASKMEVTSMTGTTSLAPVSSFVRNPDWPTNPAMVNGVQKFTGLLAVHDHPSNFVALSATAAYTVNWGDGSGDINVATGVTAERNIAYGDVTGTIVGTSDAVACTFMDAGDTVNRTAHGFENGQRVNFASITSTTGISTHTTYFVVGRAADTFQVAATLGGSALTLTTDGSGTVYIPQYKVAIVTVTPQAANNITSLSLQKKHSQTGLQKYATPWLDIAINSSFLTTLEISLVTTITDLRDLKIASLGENGITNFTNMFAGCSVLQSVPLLNTAAGTTFTNMFAYCSALQSVPLLNTAAGTNFTSMFAYCSVLQSVPLLNTAAGTNFTSMFQSCSVLQSVPLLNTAAGTNFTSMFQSCSALQSVPLLNTAAGTTFTNMFAGCSALQSVPLLNTAAGTTFTNMFSGCASLSAARLAGTPQTISYANCRLSAAALDGIYTGLATVTAKTITVTGNYGTTGDTPSIATAKGWTVTG